jgi:ABC-type phosphate transport system substrate-binding protein
MKTQIGTMLLALVMGTAAVPAFAEIVVIVNPKNPATKMFSEQAAQFFIGKSTMFTPIEHSEGAAIRGEFDQKVLGKDPSQVKAIWSKLVFTGKGSAPKEYSSSAEVKKAVAADVTAIGYIEKSAVDDTVKVILTVP